MHWLAEAQATPLKVVIGMNSRVIALAEGVVKRADPVAKPTTVSASITWQIRTARVNEFVITWYPRFPIQADEG
jgi:hypothetical protein